MLQPEKLLMKCGAQLDWEPRVDRKAFGTIGFPDSVTGISVVFSGYCPATVSDSETVFLCPVSSGGRRSTALAVAALALAQTGSYSLGFHFQANVDQLIMRISKLIG